MAPSSGSRLHSDLLRKLDPYRSCSDSGREQWPCFAQNSRSCAFAGGERRSTGVSRLRRRDLSRGRDRSARCSDRTCRHRRICTTSDRSRRSAQWHTHHRFRLNRVLVLSLD